MTTQWIALKDKLPDEHLEVNTIISDEQGLRNEQPLKRQGRLWFIPDMSMYVYYTPTHWKPLDKDNQL